MIRSVDESRYLGAPEATWKFNVPARIMGRQTLVKIARETRRNLIVSIRGVIAFAVLCLLTEHAGAVEIWLAQTPDCNACKIFERVAEEHRYGDLLQYQDGASELMIPIRRVSKDQLGTDILDQLPKDSGPDWQYWRVVLTVLVIDQGHVLASGNIADSADNRDLRHSPAVMFPAREPRSGDPALGDDDLYTPFFVAHWNLEYFIDVALGKRLPRKAASLVDLASDHPWQSAAANIVLWGSAGTPFKNALFISKRITEIRSELKALDLGKVRFVTLYGHGPQVSGNDTSYMVAGKTLFKRAAVKADFSSSGENLNRVLTGIRLNPSSHTLLIQVGHSGPTGSPLWGSGLPLTPEELTSLKQQSDAKLVMVSGACHSGLFAKAAQCGFFAAHPKVVASGCQLSSKALETSDDYLRYFFSSAAGRREAQTAEKNRGRPTARPLATLYASHWYASTRLEDHQISYTTTDALIDDYFDAHPASLPTALTVAQIRSAFTAMMPEESAALETLTTSLPADLPIPLTGYLELNKAAEEKLANARELSSNERNRITAMPYKLMLPALVRRLIYRSLYIDDARFRDAQACETRTIADALGADNSP